MRYSLDASFEEARLVMQAHAHTFYFAARLFRPERRRATAALYALFRTLDDLVDESAGGAITREEARTRLMEWRRWLVDPVQERSEPFIPAVRQTLLHYDIPARYFLALTVGLEMDLDQRRYVTVHDLMGYCFRVASTVGLAMCHVLGARSQEAHAYAAELGAAMQLTNILRDVQEDLENGRVYLPESLLAAYGWNEERLCEGQIDADFTAMVCELAALARCYYQRGLAGLRFLPPDVRPALRVAAATYAAILDRIEAANCDVFSARAYVPGSRKALILARTLLVRRRPQPMPQLPPDAPTGRDLLRLAYDSEVVISSAGPSIASAPALALARPGAR